MKRLLKRIHEDESGHAIPAMLSLAAAAGGIVLGVGAASESDVVAIIGGVVLGVGVLGAGLAEHMTVDYDIYARLEKLEGRK
jgi:hypothetical protein